MDELTAHRCRRLVVSLDHHFVEVGTEVYTDLAFGYEYWREYLDTFTELIVLARLGKAKSVPEGYFIATGPSVKFLGVPNFYGPYQMVFHLPSILRACWRAARLPTSFILRTGNVSSFLWFALLVLRKPYAREIQGMVGIATREATRKSYPLAGRFGAWFSEALTKIQVRLSACSSYVSRTCRKHYPSLNPEREFVFSSVRINDELATEPRLAEHFCDRGLRVISVGRLEREKGHHVLVDSIANLSQEQRAAIAVQIVGDGRELQRLREQVKLLGLEDTIELPGVVEYGRPLFELLDKADLFVLPSLTEGMPRALLEAMARGLPAVGCRAGGIAELLEDDQLVPPKDAVLLADAIANRIGQPEQLSKESKRNFEYATQNYGIATMHKQKLAFWSAVLEDAPFTTLRACA